MLVRSRSCKSAIKDSGMTDDLDQVKKLSLSLLWETVFFFLM